MQVVAQLYFLACCDAGDSGRGRAEGVAGAQGGGGRHRPITGRAAAALPAHADADLGREELDDRLSDSSRATQGLRSNSLSRAGSRQERRSWWLGWVVLIP